MTPKECRSKISSRLIDQVNVVNKIMEEEKVQILQENNVQVIDYEKGMVA